MARGRTQTFLTQRFDGETLIREPDELIVEEPLSIQLDDVLVTTTMRTPGNDFELAAGFCFTEGLLHDAPVRQVRYCASEHLDAVGSASAAQFNVVSVDTGHRAPPPRPRLGPASSSCGICGSQSIDDLCARLTPVEPNTISIEVLAAAPTAMAKHQALFAATGAVHAAAVFDSEGSIIVAREDIGRHNAVDKVIGWLLFERRLPAAGLGLFVSGRASFEMAQKAWAAGFGALVAVSAPSALAVETARAAGLTLAGFARDDRLKLYT